MITKEFGVTPQLEVKTLTLAIARLMEDLVPHVKDTITTYETVYSDWKQGVLWKMGQLDTLLDKLHGGWSLLVEGETGVIAKDLDASYSTSFSPGGTVTLSEEEFKKITLPATATLSWYGVKMSEVTIDQEQPSPRNLHFGVSRYIQ